MTEILPPQILQNSILTIDSYDLCSMEEFGKGGGGIPDMAQAGGVDVAKIDAALKAIKALI